MTPKIQEQVEQHLATLESEDERREVRNLFRKVVEKCCKHQCGLCEKNVLISGVYPFIHTGEYGTECSCRAARTRRHFAWLEEE